MLMEKKLCGNANFSNFIYIYAGDKNLTHGMKL